MPRISVIIPTFNTGEILIRTLGTLENQTYRDFEVIVVDDGSTDSTQDLLQRYQRLSPSFPLQSLVQGHRGASVARNTGFQNSHGEFVLFLDSDKFLVPQALERFLKVLDVHHDKAYAYCHFQRDASIYTAAPFDADKMRMRELFIDTCSLIRRDKFLGFDPQLKRLQDFDLWLGILERGDEGVLVDEVLFSTVSRPGDISSSESLDDAWDCLVNKHSILTYDIAIIMDNCDFYSGGRYYTWMLAHALKDAGFHVVVGTDRLPVFVGDFKGLIKFPVKIGEIDKLSVLANCYIGAPVRGNIRAAELAQQHQKTCYGIVFDPLPHVQKYVPQELKTEYEHFMPMVPFLKDDLMNIICLTEVGKKAISKWLDKDLNKIFVLYPRVNVDDAVRLFSVSRVVDRKNYRDLLEVVRKLPSNYFLDVVTSLGVDGLQKDIDEMGLGERVKIHQSVPDKEKFRLISLSDIVVSTSLFEGFGMWLIEGRVFGKPVVCYDYPTFREIQKVGKEKDVYLVPRRNTNAFVDTVLKISADSLRSPWVYSTLVKDVRNLFHRYRTEKSNLVVASPSVVSDFDEDILDVERI